MTTTNPVTLKRTSRWLSFVTSLAIAVVSVVAVVLLFSVAARAQVTGGTISGTVTDPSLAAVLGATVIVLNETKGESRTINTNNAGYYSTANLIPGSYSVTISSEGFASSVHSKVLMEVGQEVVVNIQLKVGSVSERVVIIDDPIAVNTTTATLSNVVSGQIVRDLPINGRDWTQLAALEPGVHTIEAQSPLATTGNARANRGFGTQMTIGGNRPQQNNYRLDGVSINDYSGGGPGNVIGLALGVDAIQEFSVVTGNASADYGRTSGGVINAVTRSGQNKFHGAGYEFLRNSALDARNFFDGATVPPFKRNQFGGSLGGPIHKDHTFFFFDYEGLRQDLGTTSVIIVPSRAARAGNLVGGAIAVNPSVRPYLSIFPLPNGPETGDTATFSSATQAVASENLITFRVDHRFSDTDSLSGVFLNDPSENQSPDSYNFALTGQKASRRSLSIEQTHIITPNLINVARFGYSRSVVGAPISLGAISPLASDTSLGFLPDSPTGSIVITGVSVFNGGVGGVGETDYTYNSYQAYDDLFYIRNNHTLKFGGAFEHIQSDVFAGGDQLGRYTFGSLRSFLLNQPTSFNGSLPGETPTLFLRQNMLAAYLQDDYRIRPNLTLNLGVRYETATVPTEKFGNLTNLVNLTERPPQPELGSPYFSNPTLLNFSPRLGFAWDPFKNGKTAIRGGFGIYDTLPLTYQFGLLVVNSNPFALVGSVSSLPAGSFPLGGFPRLTANTLRYSYIEPNPKRSYVEQWNLNVQRQLLFKIVAQVGYVGQHGVHQPFRTNDANIVLPTVGADGSLRWPTPRGSGVQLNPNAGVINSLAWQASNTYHGMNLALNRQRKGLRLGLSYTWSKSLDNSSASIAGGTFTTDIQGPFLFSPQVFRGLSSFDVRHNFVANYLWEISGIASGRDSINTITKGWQLGGIFRGASGLPFTVTTGGDSLGLKNANPFNFPDRVNTPACADPYNSGDPSHYLKTECFVAPSPGTRLGNSGRNQLIGPGLTNFDLSLIKNTTLRESVNLQFRAEFFNLFNHTNFAVLDRTSAQLFSFTASTNTFARVATAGSLNSTSTAARQIQLGVKLSF